MEYVPIQFSDESTHFQLEVYYLNSDDYAKTLHDLYYGFYSDMNAEMYFEVMNQSKENKIIASEIKNQVQIDDLGFLSLLQSDSDIVSLLNMKQINWLNDRYVNMSSQIDSIVGAFLFSSSLNYWIIYLVYFMVLIIFCSNLFSCEKQTRMDQMLFCAKKRRRIPAAKIYTMMILVMSIYAVSLLIDMISVMRIVPIENLNLAAVYTGLGIRPMTVLYSYYELLARQLSLNLCAFLCIGTLSTFLSCFTKSRFFSAVAVILFTVFPLLGTKSPLLCYTPFVMINHVTYFNLNEGIAGKVLPISEIGGVIVDMATLVCLFWIVVSGIMMISSYMKAKNSF